MQDWKDFIDEEIKNKVDLDLIAKTYLNLILQNKKKGYPDNFAIKSAKIKIVDALEKYNIKKCDITHLLHFCGLAVYPAMYAGCGCHDYIKNSKL